MFSSFIKLKLIKSVICLFIYQSTLAVTEIELVLLGIGHES